MYALSDVIVSTLNIVIGTVGKTFVKQKYPSTASIIIIIIIIINILTGIDV